MALRRGLIVVALLLVTGHVCALAPAEAEPGAAHGGGGDHDGIHADSCEGLLARPPALPALPAAVGPPVVVVPPALAVAEPLADPPGPADFSRPPLFLLHAAFLS